MFERCGLFRITEILVYTSGHVGRNYRPQLSPPPPTPQPLPTPTPTPNPLKIYDSMAIHCIFLFLFLFKLLARDTFKFTRAQSVEISVLLNNKTAAAIHSLHFFRQTRFNIIFSLSFVVCSNFLILCVVQTVWHLTFSGCGKAWKYNPWGPFHTMTTIKWQRFQQKIKSQWVVENYRILLRNVSSVSPSHPSRANTVQYIHTHAGFRYVFQYENLRPI
jgi:hypothetical protein